MYRNIVYNSRNKECIIFGWDKTGNRIKYSIPFKPYIYLITNNNNGVATSIFNEPLIKKEFETQYDRFKFLKDHEYPRVYNNLDVQQEFTYTLLHPPTFSLTKSLLPVHTSSLISSIE